MEAEQLLDLAGAFTAHHVFQPDRKALVEVGSKLFGQRIVGGIPNQDVAEAEGILSGERRPVRKDELLAHERLEALVDSTMQLLVGKRLNGSPVEDRALDRAALDREPLALAQLVEPRREQHLDRVGNGDPLEVEVERPAAVRTQEPAVDQHRHHLFDEERVAFR